MRIAPGTPGSETSSRINHTFLSVMRNCLAYTHYQVSDAEGGIPQQTNEHACSPVRGAESLGTDELGILSLRRAGRRDH